MDGKELISPMALPSQRSVWAVVIGTGTVRALSHKLHSMTNDVARKVRITNTSK